LFELFFDPEDGTDVPPKLRDLPESQIQINSNLTNIQNKEVVKCGVCGGR
jgi:hypothetical protein